MADEFTGQGLPLDGVMQQALATVGPRRGRAVAMIGVETTGCRFRRTGGRNVGLSVMSSARSRSGSSMRRIPT
jgi:hypothetical protein